LIHPLSIAPAREEQGLSGFSFWPAAADAFDAICRQGGDTIVVDPVSPAHAFPHFWEQMFGSGRAILSLRDSYRRICASKQITDFRYVPLFHGPLFTTNRHLRRGRPWATNPSSTSPTIDQSYDGLLANGVRPFVELSFMPKKLVQGYAPRLLVQAEHRAAQGLREVGRSPITSSAKHLIELSTDRRSQPVVLRGVERAQPRFLGRRTYRPLLGALRSQPHEPSKR